MKTIVKRFANKTVRPGRTVKRTTLRTVYARPLKRMKTGRQKILGR
jgi:hypothetical protein